MKRRLTERTIRDLAPGDRPVVHWDAAAPGFGVRVFPSGNRAYVAKYRTTTGRSRMATVARVGDLPLREARAKAVAIRDAARIEGADPLADREAARLAPTVAEGVARFLDEYAPERIRLGRMKQRTADEYARQARAHILPKLGEIKAADASRLDVERMARGCPPVMRNRVLGFASRLFSQFEAWEWRPGGSNPCRRIERARENPRDRTLAADELARLADALDAEAERRPPQRSAWRR